MTYAAAIDIGTHSALLLVAQCRGNRVEPQIDLARTTKLGASLTSTQLIHPEAIERLVAVLKTYQAILSEYPIERLEVFGTAALRLAENAAACRQAIADTFGWSLRILSGDEEADYTFRGVSQLFSGETGADVEAAPEVLAIDIGGGSTEIIRGTPGRIRNQWSIPVGAVLLKQQFHPGDCLTAPALEQMGQFLTNHFAVVEAGGSPRQVFVTGGTATTVAALLQDMADYDFRRIDGFYCSAHDLDMLFRELNSLTTQQRADLRGMEPGRADVIVPALVILRTLLGHLGAAAMTVTNRGARYGILSVN